MYTLKIWGRLRKYFGTYHSFIYLFNTLEEAEEHYKKTNLASYCVAISYVSRLDNEEMVVFVSADHAVADPITVPKFLIPGIPV